MLHLKLAAEEDIPAVVGLLTEFFYSSPYATQTLSLSKVEELATGFVLGAPQERIVILLCDGPTPVGILAGMVSEPLFSRERFAYEVVWWITPEYRGQPDQLLKAYEYWAKNVAGVTQVQIGSLADVRVDKMLSRKGYVPVEHTLVKDIS